MTAPVPPALALSRVSMVICYVRDALRAAAFYKDVLGLRAVEESPHWVELDGGGVRLALHPHPNVPQRREETLPWIVFEVGDVHAAHRTLVERGVAVHGPPKEVCRDATRIGLSLDLDDPDGNHVSLFGYVPITA